MTKMIRLGDIWNIDPVDVGEGWPAEQPIPGEVGSIFHVYLGSGKDNPVTLQVISSGKCQVMGLPGGAREVPVPRGYPPGTWVEPTVLTARRRQ